MPGIFDSIKFVKKKLTKTVENDTDLLMSTVVYNTKENLIILLSFGSKHFYSVLEFLAAIHNTPNSVNCILSHTAIEKELTEEENADFDKKPVKMIDNKYYLLISGHAKAYLNLFNYVDQSNTILEELVKDIYHYCDSAVFQPVIDAGILQEFKFTYKRIKPNYDNHKAFDNSINMKIGRYDNVDIIFSKLPNIYNRLDLCRIINIYYDNNKSITAAELIKQAMEYDHDSKTDNPYFYALFRLMCKNDYLYTSIIKNPCIENLSAVTKPIYLRSDEDEEDELTADLPIEALDEIFQQEYDRFVNPTADAGVEYEDIDERLGDDEETENMRKADMIYDEEDN